MQLSQKKKIFFQFFFAFLKVQIQFYKFSEKMTLIADIFAKLRTPTPRC